MPQQITRDVIDRMKGYEVDAKRRISETRTRFIMGDSPVLAFFGALVMRLKMEPNWFQSTASTDGKKMYYNPHFICKLTPDEALGVMVHEVLHITNKFFDRLGPRELERANIAHDLAINHIIKEAGMTLPADGCFPGVPPFQDMPPSLAMEEYYNLLPKDIAKQMKNGGGGGGSGKGQGDQTIVLQSPVEGVGEGQPRDFPADTGGSGTVIKAGDKSESAQKEMDAEWDVAVKAAADLARQCAESHGGRSNMPGFLERLIGEISKPTVNWPDILRQFMTAFTKDDYAWSRPNRRLLGQDIILPSLHSERMGEILILVDTSGSITEFQIRKFLAEVISIIELKPVRLTIAYHTTRPYRIDRWEPADGPYKLPRILTGGTSHEFLNDEWMDKENIKPVCAVCLTDLETLFPPAPEFPVFWGVLGSSMTRAPYGITVPIKIYEE